MPPLTTVGKRLLEAPAGFGVPSCWLRAVCPHPYPVAARSEDYSKLAYSGLGQGSGRRAHAQRAL